MGLQRSNIGGKGEMGRFLSVYRRYAVPGTDGRNLILAGHRNRQK